MFNFFKHFMFHEALHVRFFFRPSVEQNFEGTGRFRVRKEKEVMWKEERSAKLINVTRATILNNEQSRRQRVRMKLVLFYRTFSAASLLNVIDHEKRRRISVFRSESRALLARKGRHNRVIERGRRIIDELRSWTVYEFDGLKGIFVKFLELKMKILH